MPDRSVVKFLFFFINFLVLFLRSQASSPYKIGPSIYCKQNEYLDVSSLSCVSCSIQTGGSGSNRYKVPNFEHTDVFGNALSCVCAAGYEIVPTTCTDSAMLSGACAGFSCVSCGNSTAFSDGSACTPCHKSQTLGFSRLTKQCLCPKDQLGFPYLLTDEGIGGRRINKTCAKCAAGDRVITKDFSTAGVNFVADPTRCQTCPDINMNFVADGSCACNTGYVISGVAAIGPTFCLQETRVATVITTFPQAMGIQVNYFQIQVPNQNVLTTASLSSITFQHYYLLAATNCYTFRGPEDLRACQILGNLCVLQNYNSQSQVCQLFKTIQRSRIGTSWQQPGWGSTLPWLFYATTASLVTSDSSIAMRMTFAKAQRSGFANTMVYVFASYSLNGTFLGMVNLTTQFFYCSMPAPNTDLGGGNNRPTNWLRFGHATTERFQCDLETLIGQEPVFYDPYVLDQSTGSLYPMPVLNRNLQDNNIFVNQNNAPGDESNDIFTRRFFLFDPVGGISSSSTRNTEGNLVPDVLRYAQNIKLSVKIQLQAPQQIFPPTLTIYYNERKPSDWAGAPGMKIDTITFQVEYTMDTTQFWNVATGLFSMCIVIMSAMIITRLLNHQKRNTRLASQVVITTGLPCTFTQMFTWAAIGMHSFVRVFFILVFVLCSYWFTFFKLQDTVYAMLPSDDYSSANEYYTFYIFMHVMFVSQLVWIMYIVRKQVTVDVFFIDWEKPKGASIQELRKSSASRKGVGGQGVSIWRLLLCSNEWNKLQAYRYLSIEFSLLWISFFLVALNLQYNATPQPNLYDVSPGPVNLFLQFTNTVWWWLMISLVQFLWRFLCGDRIFSDPKAWQFIDVCTMAKVSCLVLDEKYHGYYIHCRSPHPNADVALKEMTDCLNSEALGQRVNRGLEWGPPDVQTFEIFLTEKFRQKYNNVYNDLILKEMAVPFLNATGRLGELQMRANIRSPKKGPSSDRAIDAARNMNRFLQGFISRQYQAPELKCEFKEQTWWGRLFQIPPDLRAGSTPCVFMEDKSMKFTSVHLLGIELDLLLLNILTFCICDIWFGQTMTSVLVTYLLDKAVIVCRSYFGQKNLAGKTLVDERFFL